MIPLVREAERRLASIAKPLQVAMMGCLVNGPGEGREADIGVCGGRGEALLFKKGRVVRKIKLEEMVDPEEKSLVEDAILGILRQIAEKLDD